MEQRYPFVGHLTAAVVVVPSPRETNHMVLAESTQASAHVPLSVLPARRWRCLMGRCLGGHIAGIIACNELYVYIYILQYTPMSDRYM